MTQFKILTVATCSLLMLLGCDQLTESAMGQGFRIGRVMQAGGGQGFRLGGARAGMQFGGGQGASFGLGRLGMRFGNGQGARIGGENYGMQFGGQQGTQIGRFATTPVVNPGTYYYNDVRQLNVVGPMAGPPIVNGQIINGQVIGTQVLGGQVIDGQIIGNSIIPSVPNATSSTIANSIPGQVITSTANTAPDKAFATSEMTETSMSIAANETGINDATSIQISYPATATAALELTLNGNSKTLNPGETVSLRSGTEWSLGFAAGGEHGDRVATLSDPGSFAFMQTEDEGWILVQATESQAAESSSDGVEAAPIESPAEPAIDSDSGTNEPTSNQPEDEPTQSVIDELDELLEGPEAASDPDGGTGL